MTVAAGIIAGAAIFGAAIGIWYVFSRLHAKSRLRPVPKEEPTKLEQKIKEALIEARMILPGAQAFLGFQVANAFTNSFDQLPRRVQWTHFGSLLCVAISTIFLMAPAAYHRIAEHGEDSEEFYKVSGIMLLTAMFWLALGIASDLWVILRKTTQSDSFALGVSAVTLLFFYAAWFGYSLQKRRQIQRERLAS